MLAFVLSFSALGSSLLAQGEQPAAQCLETVLDVSESNDAEEPNPSDESKHFVFRSHYIDHELLSSFQRVAFDYSYEQNLAPNKPPQS